MSDATMQLIGAFVTLAILVFPVVKSFADGVFQHVEARLPQSLHETLQSVVSHAVDAVEQMSTTADEAVHIAPEDRKQAALNAAQDILSHLGLKVPASVIDTYIEAAVSALKPTGFTGTFDYQAGTSSTEQAPAAPLAAA